MKMNNNRKHWMMLLLSAVLVCVSGLTMLVYAETTIPNASEAAEANEVYWLDEVEGEVILEDPAYLMDAEEAEDKEAIPTVQPDNTPDAENSEPSATDPISTPTVSPDVPTESPTAIPTEQPTQQPTEQPTEHPTEQPTETPVVTAGPPVDLKTLFDVDILVPSGWRNSNSASVRIKITPTGDQQWYGLRYRIGSEEWVNVPNANFVLYDGYYYSDVDVTSNTKMVVRLFEDAGAYFDTAKDIRIFDRRAPEVTAGFKDMLLHVEATDDLSEVAGIQVSGLLFTTLIDGKLDVRMEESLLDYRQLAIRAYDYAGNFSDPVMLDNAYYVEPTPQPIATPKPTSKPTSKPTKKPSGGSSASSSSGSGATEAPVVTATPAATEVPLQQQVVYVTPDPDLYSYYQPQVTAEPETVYVPIGPGQPFKGGSNMQTMDMLYSAATNKQFITVQSRNGETYYLIIDYDKPIDEENDIYETYFLNMVDDRDLMAVVSEDEIQPTSTPQIVYVTPEPTQVPRQPIIIEDDEGESSLPMLLVAVGVAVVGGAAFWFVRKKKNDGQKLPDFDDEFEFEEEEDEE